MAAPVSGYACTEAAEVYGRLAVPLQFAAPAKDLVAAVEMQRGQRVLDVGTGTGAAATAAAAAVGPAGLVVGMDASLAMLRRPPPGLLRPVAARAPDLPFRPASFDAAVASFVLSHVDDPVETLRHIAGVLRPRARIGVSGWGGGPTAAESLWNDVTTRFASVEELQQALRLVIPHARRFSSADGLAHALRDADYELVVVFSREYTITMDRDAYLALRTASVEGQLLRQRIGEGEWTAFVRSLDDGFRRNFGAAIAYRRDVHFAIAALFDD